MALVLKERLKLNNFTGKTVAVVKQNFFAALFMVGLESILTQAAELHLFNKSSLNEFRQTVNNMVFFNALIAYFMVEMFYHPMPIDSLMKILNERRKLRYFVAWFITDSTYRKRWREVIRKKSSARVSLNYYKRIYKPCF